MKKEDFEHVDYRWDEEHAASLDAVERLVYRFLAWPESAVGSLVSLLFALPMTFAFVAHAHAQDQIGRQPVAIEETLEQNFDLLKLEPVGSALQDVFRV